MILVVFSKATRKVILLLPLYFDGDAWMTQGDALLFDGYGYEVFVNREPVLYEDADGDICLKPNSCIINSDILLNEVYEEDDEEEE